MSATRNTYEPIKKDRNKNLTSKVTGNFSTHNTVPNKQQSTTEKARYNRLKPERKKNLGDKFNANISAVTFANQSLGSSDNTRTKGKSDEEGRIY